MHSGIVSYYTDVVKNWVLGVWYGNRSQIDEIKKTL